MNAVIEFLGKAGGILAIASAVIAFIFREYFKARLTDAFAGRIEQRRNAREDAFLLSEVIARTRGTVVEKLVDARLQAIESMAARSSALSESVTSLHASRQVMDNVGSRGEQRHGEAVIASGKAFDEFAHTIASNIPHLPESVIDRAREFQGAVIAQTRKLSDAQLSYLPNDFSAIWSAENALQEALRRAILSTITMPESIAMATDEKWKPTKTPGGLRRPADGSPKPSV